MASHYVKEVVAHNQYWEFWDWRDCKEKENRIHTKITSAIERLTNGTIKASQLTEDSIDDVIEFFFTQLGDRKIVYVFDNVDAYVDLDKFQLFGPVEKLYNAALNKSHKAKFIFTCRTSISDIDTRMLMVRLQGLSEDDTLMLFQKYSLAIGAERVAELSRRAFLLTKGHPLWLNLIAAQARRGADAAEKFINGIKGHSSFDEENISSILSDKILKSIWDGLSGNQKDLLRALAESVRAESEQNLSRILDSEMTGNKFFKSLKSLKQLNLIVIKSRVGEPDSFELHPLVREYILQNFIVKERSKYITLFVNFYDGIISVLKHKITIDQPLSFYENWTIKIELLINNGEFKSALAALQEISDPLYDSGYTEEYVRVAKLLFNSINWLTAINEEYSYFHAQLNDLIWSLTNIGKYDDAQLFLNKYQGFLNNKNIDYINFCDSKSHYYWFKGDCDKAIIAATEAVALDEQNGAKIGTSFQRTLGLALRDTKETDNIYKAIELFRAGNELDLIVSGEVNKDISGEVYGNIGRCLQYLGRNEDAIKCYVKSLSLVANKINKGYAYHWIGEILLTLNKFEPAAYFYQQAAYVWKLVSPVKSDAVCQKLNSMVNFFPAAEHVVTESEESISHYCNKYLAEL